MDERKETEEEEMLRLLQEQIAAQNAPTVEQLQERQIVQIAPTEAEQRIQNQRLIQAILNVSSDPNTGLPQFNIQRPVRVEPDDSSEPFVGFRARGSEQRGQLGQRQSEDILKETEDFLENLLQEEEKSGDIEIQFDVLDIPRAVESLSSNILTFATSNARSRRLQEILDVARENIIDGLNLDGEAKRIITTIINSVKANVSTKAQIEEREEKEIDPEDVEAIERTLFAERAIKDLEDEVFGNIDLSQENLTQDEIFNIANDFLTEIDFRSLNELEIKAIANEIINNVANDQLRFLLLEELNRIALLPESDDFLRLEPEDIRAITLSEGRIGLETRAETNRLNDLLNTFTDLQNDTVQAVIDNRENIDQFGSSEPGEQSDLLIGDLFKLMDKIEEFGNIKREKIDFTKFGFNKPEEEKEPEPLSSVTLGDEKGFKGQFEKDLNKIEDEESRLDFIGDRINSMGRFIEDKLKQVKTKTIDISTRKDIKEVSDSAKRSISEFVKTLKKDTVKMKKKPKAVHMPHRINKIGNVIIHSDRISGIKEIIITGDASGEDISKLAHSLASSDGILATIDGKFLIEITGINKDFRKVLTVLLEYIQTQPKGERIQLLYKAFNRFADHVVGGSFTNQFYNKSNFKDSVLGTNFLFHDIRKKRFLGGTLIRNFLFNPVHPTF